MIKQHPLSGMTIEQRKVERRIRQVKVREALKTKNIRELSAEMGVSTQCLYQLLRKD